MSGDALRYESAGVDIDASNAAKNRIRKLVESTLTAGVVGGFGGFGGMFRIPPGLKKPVPPKTDRLQNEFAIEGGHEKPANRDPQ